MKLSFRDGPQGRARNLMNTLLCQCVRRPVFTVSGLASPGGRPLRAVPGIARAPEWHRFLISLHPRRSGPIVS